MNVHLFMSKGTKTFHKLRFLEKFLLVFSWDWVLRSVWYGRYKQNEIPRPKTLDLGLQTNSTVLAPTKQADSTHRKSQTPNLFFGVYLVCISKALHKDRRDPERPYRQPQDPLPIEAYKEFVGTINTYASRQVRIPPSPRSVTP